MRDLNTEGRKRQREKERVWFVIICELLLVINHKSHQNIKDHYRLINLVQLNHSPFTFFLFLHYSESIIYVSLHPSFSLYFYIFYLSLCYLDHTYNFFFFFFLLHNIQPLTPKISKLPSTYTVSVDQAVSRLNNK